MESNKEEACKAKYSAELKLAVSDFRGARESALIAQSLYPELDGLSGLMAVLDVHIAAEEGVNGDVDWHKILGVRPSADKEEICKKYKKLALAFHPDKNKSVGAEGAFKLVKQAKETLETRMDAQLCTNGPGFEYWSSSMFTEQNFYHGNYQSNTSDSTGATQMGGTDGNSSSHASHYTFHDFFNRNQSHTTDCRTETQMGGDYGVHDFYSSNQSHTTYYRTATHLGGDYGFHDFFNSNQSHTTFFRTATQMGGADEKSSVPTSHYQSKTQPPGSATGKSKDSKPSTSRPPKDKNPTFWTVCPHCNRHFKYPKPLLNCNLICYNCTKSFKARQKPPAA